MYNSEFDLTCLCKFEKNEVFSLREFLELSKKDPSTYDSVHNRLLKAIGEPNLIDTTKDPRLTRIFLGKTIRVYDAFSDFYGNWEVIEEIVQFCKHAAQGLEERKQILYLLGPVGGGKSSLAERLKKLIENEPIYVLTDSEGAMSPLYESPLGLFDRESDGVALESTYGIPQRKLISFMSPWAVKILDQQLDGDASKFKVTKTYPSRLREIGITKVEPGDENNQDISSLVGKVNIRELESYGQDDARAYSFSGGLNKTSQGLLEFVEMFKAPLKMLHPLLTALQEGNYTGTESIGAMPFAGMILAHSNESEWQNFKNNRSNEAMLDRIRLIQVPYCLEFTEEQKIYRKLLNGSELVNAPRAPGTLEMLSQFVVMSRLKVPDNSELFAKLRVYDGEDLRDTDTQVKSVFEYREEAGITEGMEGLSTRFAFKVLSATYNKDTDEIAADPVQLMSVLKKRIKEERFPSEIEDTYLACISEVLAPRFSKKLGEELQKAYFEEYESYGQRVYERYIKFADAWLEDNDCFDPDTGERYDRDQLDEDLSRIEKAAGIANPKDFRHEIVMFAFRKKSETEGRQLNWKDYHKIREAIQKYLFSSIKDLSAVISFGAKTDGDSEKKHAKLIKRMKDGGYTENQIKRLVGWYQHYNNS